MFLTKRKEMVPQKVDTFFFGAWIRPKTIDQHVLFSIQVVRKDRICQYVRPSANS